MWDPELHRRIEEWNRLRVRETVSNGSVAGLGRERSPAMHYGQRIETRPIRLNDGTATVTASGECWMSTVPLCQIAPSVLRSLSNLPVGNRQSPQETAEASDPDVHCLARSFPNDTLFVDVETCGLSGSMVFLIGLIHSMAGQPTLTQLLARDYSEESAILTKFWEIVGSARVMVSFNGKSFDWPMIRDRSAVHLWHHIPSQKNALGRSSVLSGLYDKPPLDHVDLLHVSRRLLRGKLPDFRLQTLERYLCHRWRINDVAGEDIPAIYHDFVRGSQRETMEAVLLHNALDLLTSFELAAKFVQCVPLT